MICDEQCLPITGYLMTWGVEAAYQDGRENDDRHDSDAGKDDEQSHGALWLRLRVVSGLNRYVVIDQSKHP